MPSVKAVVKNDFVKSDGKAKIYFRIIHKDAITKKKRVRYIPTDYYIEPKYMGTDGKVKSNYPGQSTMNGAIISLDIQYNTTIAQLGTSIKYMNIDQLVDKLTGNVGDDADFFVYAITRIDSLLKEKRYSLAELYGVTLNHLKGFTENDSVLFREITPEFLLNFETFLKINGSSVNTVRNYMCNIRAIFNHAINKGKAVKQEFFPFREYRIVSERKRPRAIDLNDIRRLLMAQPYLSGSEQRSVDIFLLIFYTGGTNLKDLLYLKHHDYYKDRIIYNRFKTGREYSIKVYPEAKEILDRYQGEKYLLSFIERKNAITPIKRQGYGHKDLLGNTNKYLKLAGQKCGIALKLNTYVARYSFATIAGRLEISKDVISHILGHGENTMTDIYIDFDEKKADEAIKKVIDALKVNL